MSKVSRRALLALALVPAVALSVLVGGCGKGEEEDPYVAGTLDQVTRGFVQSEDYLFEVPAPEFIFTSGNTGIARVGNHLEVIVADDLENRAPSWDGKLLGVQKFFSPYVWLMVKRVKEPLPDGTFSLVQLDSVRTPLIPKFTNVNLEEVSGFDLGTLEYNKKQQIEDMKDAEVQGVGELLYLPDHEAEQTEVAEGETPPEPKMAWYLKAEGSDATFKITNVDDQLEFAFHLLESQGLPFIGGVKIGEPYTWAERRETRVSCPVQVTFLRYANRYLAP